MKIAFLAGTLGQGGAEKQLFLLAKELHQKGDEVVIYCLRQGDFWESKLREEGIHVLTFANREQSKFSRLMQLFRAVQAYRPDIFYSFHFYTSVYAAIIGRLLGIFSIGSIRNNGNIEKASNAKLGYLHFNLPHAIIANSRHGLDNSQRIFYRRRKKVAILTNALLPNQVKPRIVKQENNPISILFVGRLEAQKRPLFFLEIIKALKQQTKRPIQAIMLGDGKLKRELTTYCQEHDLVNEVELKGKVPNVADYMAISDMLLCTSDFEGTPNVILEAMIAQLPVVTANFEGVDTLIGHQNERGFMFADIKTAIQQMLTVDEHDVSDKTEKAKAFVKEHYAIENLAQRFYSIINKLQA